ncbi:chromosomal replication initiator protein DnaA, partial [bacterium]|nr:chromosomal replication initiator protein DnaA [bacterium]
MNIGGEILMMLKDEISEIDYNRYIKQLSFSTLQSKSNYAVYFAPNALIANYIKRKFSDKIAHLFEVKTGTKTLVSIELKSAKKGKVPQKIEQKNEKP